MTISAPLTGNLGNHMFIYAITRTVAEKNGYNWGFNPHPEYDYHKGNPQMDFMEIDYGKIHNFTYENKPSWAKHIWKEKHQPRVGQTGHSYNYNPLQLDVFDIKDNTVLYIRCGQDARYYDKDKLKHWFKIKNENKGIYKAKLREFGIDIEQDNVAVINVRGGEYKGVPWLLLRKKYWEDAMNIMREKNPKMQFLCVTDDVAYANKLFDFKIPVTHLSIGGDYYILNNAKNIILSNSSFGIFPSWLNENKPFVIAPMFWSRHNVSDGYWANSDIWTFPWNFLGRNGELHKNDSL